MSKFSVGQRVYLFNSLSMEIEDDLVYGLLYVPIAVEGVVQDSGKDIGERLASGEMTVHEQYQLAGHQGVLEASSLFASEEDCRKFYREFFSE